jgi:subtilisin family serine protease
MVRRAGRWKVALLTVVTVGIAAAAVAVASASQTAEGTVVGAGGRDAVPNSYIVVFKPSVSADVVGRTRTLATQYGISVRNTYQAALHGFAGTMSLSAAQQLAASPDVAYVQQNHVVRIDTTQTNPPSWGLDRVDQQSLPLDNSYTYATTASSVHVYVIDTGIRLSHSDFTGRLGTGVDEVTGGLPDDCNGHGTHVAGIIGGTTYGVAKGVTLVPVRVLGCDGSGTSAEVIAGVDWVAAHAVKPAVANLSLGGVKDTALDTAVTAAVAAGITVTAAAGNDDADACASSPADDSAHGAITVAATDSNDNRADFSDYGSCVTLFAPGVKITSDWNTGDAATQVLSGTSMAAPHVAGAAALILDANPTFTPAQVSTALTGSATPSQVVNRGANSPNLILYTGTSAPPAPPANDFDMSASPNPLQVVANGQFVSPAFQTTITSGSPQPVTYSTSGVPSGVTVGIAVPLINVTGAGFPIDVTVPTGTATGWYSFAITAVTAQITHSLTFTFRVTDGRGAFIPIAPVRIVDDRTGGGPMGPGSTMTFQPLLNDAPMEQGTTVVLNVTSTGATANSFLTVYPANTPRPNTSSLNLVAGRTVANSVTVTLGFNGAVSVYNNAGSTYVIVDQVGYYTIDTSSRVFGLGGDYQPVIPQRLFDSRVPTNSATKGAKVPGGSWVEIPVDYGALANPRIRALVVNVTAVSPSAAGFLSAADGTLALSGPGAVVGTSTVNFQAGDGAVPNMAIVPVTTEFYGVPSIGVYTNVASHIVVDIMGFFDDGTLGGDGMRFTPLTPTRIVDTRIGQGAPRLGPGTTATITAPTSVTPAGTAGLAVNLTAVSPTAATYISVWPAGISGLGQPYVSSLNPTPGQIEPNSVYTLIGPTNAFNVYNNAGNTNILVDVVGTFWTASVPSGVASAGGAVPLSGRQPWQLTGDQSPARLVR